MNISIPEVIQDLALNIINIVVLFLIISLLVYKPVRKFLAERTARVEAQKAESDEKLKALEERSRQLEQEIKVAEERSGEIINAAEHTAKLNSDKIITEAHKDAKRILDKARQETVIEHNEMISSLNGEITQLAIEMSEKILQREVNSKDNARIVDEFFSNENSSACEMLKQTVKRISRAERLAAQGSGEEQ